MSLWSDELLGSRRQRVARAVILTAALVATVYGVVAIDPGLGWSGTGLAALVCTVVGTAGWLALVVGRAVRERPPLLFAAVALLTIGGGVLTALRPNGPAFAFCGVGAFTAAALPSIPPSRAVALAVAGATGMIGTAVGAGLAPGAALGTAAGLAAITLGGFNRRQFRVRLAQAEQLNEQSARTQQEQARTAALAERARIAREIHDVLAHSLGALAVQLDAADALLADGHHPGRAREHVVRARRLAVDGLTETRRAIGALRGDALPLPELLAALVDAEATLTIRGAVRDLPPDVALAVYRTAQEGLSNARKHAPGAAVTVDLAYGHDDVVLTVTDRLHTGAGRAASDGSPSATTAPPVGPAAGGAMTSVALAGTGGGYGLTGLTERAALIGGTLAAGPDGAGWTLTLRLPA